MGVKAIKHSKWLISELTIWVKDGIINNEQAEKLRNMYDAGEKKALAKVIFTSIGAVFFGLGVILFYAYNWDIIPKIVKLCTIFIAIGAAHGTAYYLNWKKEGSKNLAEGLHVLGTMLFGAGIWLIAQVYHIEEHYPNGLLVWGIAAWVLAWALPSIAQCIIAAIILIFWNLFEVLDFRYVMHFAPFLLLICTIPLAWIKRSRTLLGIGTIAFFITISLNVGIQHSSFLLPFIFFCATSLIMLSFIMEENKNFPASSPVFFTIGMIPFMFIMYLLSFEKSAYWFFYNSSGNPYQSFYFWIPCLVSLILVFIAVLLRYKKKKIWYEWIRLEFLSALILIIVYIFKYREILVMSIYNYIGSYDGLTKPTLYLEGWAFSTFFNAVFFIQSLAIIFDGIKNLNTKKTTLGVVLLAILAFTRYADLFESLLVRSIVFLLIGIAVFIVGIFYTKLKKKQEVV